MGLALIILAAMAGATLLLEGFLRWRFGLGSPPLYVADARTGYRLAPNQILRRMANRIEINQYSMRNRSIDPLRADQTLRILMLGDSIVNGGWWTDQTQTIAQQLEDRLSMKPPLGLGQAEVLNASANSWGPRHQLGYVMQFGSFEAQVVVVVLNTDDLFAIAPTSIQVGRDRAYPQHRPPLALVELLQRWQPSPPLEAYQVLLQEPGDRVGANLEALRQLQIYTQTHGGRLLLAMTPLLREVHPPGSRDYELTARDRLQQFAQREQIPYLDLLPIFQAHGHPADLYRDHIHLSPQGNQRVVAELEAWIRSLLPGAAREAERERTGDPFSDPLADPW